MASKIRWRERQAVEKRDDCQEYFHSHQWNVEKYTRGSSPACDVWVTTTHITGVTLQTGQPSAPHSIFTRPALVSLELQSPDLGQVWPGSVRIIDNKWTDTSHGPQVLTRVTSDKGLQRRGGPRPPYIKVNILKWARRTLDECLVSHLMSLCGCAACC